MINLSDIPSHPKPSQFDGGYLYVVAQSSGLVKVGRSRNPRARIRTHVDSAAAHGVSVVNVWVSTRHDNYAANESRLIRLLGSAEHGNEYFRVAFDVAVQAARSLHFHVISDLQRDLWRKQSDQRSDEFARSLFGDGYRILVPPGKHAVLVPDEFPTAWALGTVFADELPPSLPIGDLGGLAESIELVVAKTGMSWEEVVSMSYLDILHHIAKTVLHCQILELQYQALVAGRTDLTSAYWSEAVSE